MATSKDPKTAPAEKQDLSEWEKGYRGEVPDTTPNAAYTVAGVTSGAATPEADKATEATE